MAVESEVIQLGVGFDSAQANAALDSFVRATEQRLNALKQQFADLACERKAPSTDAPTVPVAAQGLALIEAQLARIAAGGATVNAVFLVLGANAQRIGQNLQRWDIPQSFGRKLGQINSTLDVIEQRFNRLQGGTGGLNLPPATPGPGLPPPSALTINSATVAGGGGNQPPLPPTGQPPQPPVPPSDAPRRWNDLSGALDKFNGSATRAGSALSIGLTAPLVLLGNAARRSSAEIDANVNVLKAFLGSTQQAEARYKQLLEIARQTPGLTGGLAATIEAQGRIAEATEASINKVLPAIGRLNAIKPIEDPQKFVGNLVQLISQNFERADLKELVGNSPFAGELIKQIFKVDSPTNSKAIRAAAQKFSIDTVDELFTALGKAAEENPRLQAVTESIASRLEKSQERLALALRPLGDRLNESLIAALQTITPFIERLAARFNDLDPGMQRFVIALGIAAAAVGPLLFVLGSLAGALSSLIAFFSAGGVGATALGAAVTALGGPLGVLVAVLAGAGLAWYAFGENAKEAAQSAKAALKVNEDAVKSLDALSAKQKLDISDKEKIAKLYNDLTPAQQSRVRVLGDESNASSELERELNGLLRVYQELHRELAKQAFDKAKAEAEGLSGTVNAQAQELQLLEGQLKKSEKELEEFAAGTRKADEGLDAFQVAAGFEAPGALKILDNSAQSISERVVQMRQRMQELNDNGFRASVQRIFDVAAMMDNTLGPAFIRAQIGAENLQRAIEAIGFVEIDPLTGRPLNPNSPLVQPFESARKTKPAPSGAGGAKRAQSVSPADEEALRQMELARQRLEELLEVEEAQLRDAYERGQLSAEEYQAKLLEVAQKFELAQVELRSNQIKQVARLRSLDAQAQKAATNRLQEEIGRIQHESGLRQLDNHRALDTARYEQKRLMLERELRLEELYGRLTLDMAEDLAEQSIFSQRQLAELQIKAKLDALKRERKRIDDEIAGGVKTAEERERLITRRKEIAAEEDRITTVEAPSRFRAAAREDADNPLLPGSRSSADERSLFSANRSTARAGLAVTGAQNELQAVEAQLKYVTGQREKVELLKKELELRAKLDQAQNAEKLAQVNERELRDKQGVQRRIDDAQQQLAETQKQIAAKRTDIDLAGAVGDAVTGAARATELAALEQHEIALSEVVRRGVAERRDIESQANADRQTLGQQAQQQELQSAIEQQELATGLELRFRSAFDVIREGFNTLVNSGNSAAAQVGRFGNQIIGVFERMRQQMVATGQASKLDLAAGLLSVVGTLPGLGRFAAVFQAIQAVIEGIRGAQDLAQAATSTAEGILAAANLDPRAGVFFAAAAAFKLSALAHFAAAGAAAAQAAVTAAGGGGAAASAGQQNQQAQANSTARDNEPRVIVLDARPIQLDISSRTDEGVIAKVVARSIDTNSVFRNLISGVAVEGPYASA